MQKTIFLVGLVIVSLCLRAYAGGSSLVAWWKFDGGRSIGPGGLFAGNEGKNVVVNHLCWAAFRVPAQMESRRLHV